MVEDRRFRIPIEIECWEEANPILLGEDLDHRLGLDSTEAQEDLLRKIFSSKLVLVLFLPPIFRVDTSTPNSVRPPVSDREARRKSASDKTGELSRGFLQFQI